MVVLLFSVSEETQVSSASNRSRYWVQVLKNSSQQGVLDCCYWFSLAIWCQGRRWMLGKAAYWLASFSPWHSFLYHFSGPCHTCPCSTGKWHYSFSQFHFVYHSDCKAARQFPVLLQLLYVRFPWSMDESDGSMRIGGRMVCLLQSVLQFLTLEIAKLCKKYLEPRASWVNLWVL